MDLNEISSAMQNIGGHKISVGIYCKHIGFLMDNI